MTSTVGTIPFDREPCYPCPRFLRGDWLPKEVQLVDLSAASLGNVLNVKSLHALRFQPFVGIALRNKESSELG